MGDPVIRVPLLSLLLGLALLAACEAPQVTPPLEGPLQVYTLKRDIFLRGALGQTTFIAPALGSRSYAIACAQAPASPPPQRRAEAALALIERSEGKIATQMLEDKIAVASEMRRLNPMLQQQTACTITAAHTTVTSQDMARVRAFVARNGLRQQLEATKYLPEADPKG